MRQTGGCYCGELKYEITGAPLMKGQCHCRECQYIAGGGPQYYMAIRSVDFQLISGSPKAFQRRDLANAVTREFCENCGTHIVTRRSDFEGVLLKVGTLDHPAEFRAPRIAIFTKDAQPFHHIPTELTCFEGLPDM
ncbi:MAG: GFA family protein [Paracoccaceae bacterium]